jgi:hypothetical protein
MSKDIVTFVLGERVTFVVMNHVFPTSQNMESDKLLSTQTQRTFYIMVSVTSVIGGATHESRSNIRQGEASRDVFHFAGPCGGWL